LGFGFKGCTDSTGISPVFWALGLRVARIRRGFHRCFARSPRGKAQDAHKDTYTHALLGVDPLINQSINQLIN